MLAMRFEMEDPAGYGSGSGDWSPALQSLKRSRRMSAAPCVSPECCAKKASSSSSSSAAGIAGAPGAAFESCCGRGGALFATALDPADDDDTTNDAGGDDTSRRGRHVTALSDDAQELLPCGVGGDDFEDFDLGPPPPCGPVLVRQNAMDATAMSETKATSLTQKLHGGSSRATASSSSSAALRSSSLISSSSSALSRRSRFVGA